MSKLTNKEWIELIKNNMETIREVGEKAYKDALEDKHLRFIVEMDSDEEVKSWYDVAGGNSFTQESYNGESKQLFQFCFQYDVLEITKENIIDKLKEKNVAEEIIESLQDEADRECTSLECIIINNHDEYKNIIEECIEDEKAFQVSEYAIDTINEKIDMLISNLENETNWKE